MIKCFNSIYYDFRSDKMVIVETVEEDGKIKQQKQSIGIEHYYYVEDKTKQSKIKDIYGLPVIKKIAKNKFDLKDLKSSGVYMCESDLAEDIKFLHDRYENENLKPKIEYYNIGYIDIELESGSAFGQKEIDNTVYPINLITIKSSKTGEIHSFGSRPYDWNHEHKNWTYRWIPDEKDLIEEFIKFFRKSKIQMVVGWNVGFDINYILNRAKQLGINETMSPVGNDYFYKRKNNWSIGGVSILDYMRFFRDPKFSQEKLESYSLQFVGMHELGEGKIKFEGSINDLYKRDWRLYVDYNIQDVLLVEKLEKKKKYLELTINLCHKSLIPFEKIFSAVAIVEGQMLSFLHKENKVMTDRKSSGFSLERDEDLEGGYVEAYPGLYEEVVSYDFESLYPHIILHGNVSPETLVLNPGFKEGLIKTVLSESDGIYYRKDIIGVIPRIIDINFKERKEFKELKKKYEQEGNKELTEFYDQQQWIRKILLNSVFGITALPFFHYYDINLARTITMGGQHLIRFVKDSFNKYFNEHFYKNKDFFTEEKEENKLVGNKIAVLDTDSLFIQFKEIKKLVSPNESFINWTGDFNKKFLTEFFNKILDYYFEKHYGVKNIMNFKLEKVISEMVVFGKKNYATVLLSNEGVIYKEPKFSVTGFASRRSDRPSFCRKKINDTLKLFFECKDKYNVIEEIRKIKTEFKQQEIEVISTPKTVTDYKKYAKTYEFYDKHGLVFDKHTPIHNRSSILYNYIVKENDLPYQFIDDGAKIKYLYVLPNNRYKTYVIGYIGNYPEVFNNIFKIDYNEQFNKTFLEAMQSLFTAVGWGEIDLNEEKDSFVS